MPKPKTMASDQKGLFVEDLGQASSKAPAKSANKSEAKSDAVGHRERLRARLIDGGSDALHDYELLEFVLFGARPRGDTKPLAKALIRAFGGFSEVITAEPERLRQVEGVSEAVVGAIKIVAAASELLAKETVINKPVLSSWTAVIKFCHTKLAHKNREEFHLLFLDRKNRLIEHEPHGLGTVDQAQVYVREIVKRALELNASALILVHNHPSGDPQPSKADVAVTREIQKALAVVGIDTHDHLIIGRKGHASFKAMGLL